MLVRVTLGENPAAPRPEVGYGCQKCQLIIGEGTNELKRLAGHAMATPYTPESIVRSDKPSFFVGHSLWYLLSRKIRQVPRSRG